jgi:hypothetical protein
MVAEVPLSDTDVYAPISNVKGPNGNGMSRDKIGNFSNDRPKRDHRGGCLDLRAVDGIDLCGLILRLRRVSNVVFR